MQKEATESEYVGLNELFRMVQEGRRRLGLREYKSRWGLIFALRQNRIPFVRKNQRVKLYHAPTAQRVLCPGAYESPATLPDDGEVWATLGTVWRHANELRLRLGLRPFKRPECMGMTLLRKRVPRRRYGRRNYYYRLPEALHALTRCEHAKDKSARHRVGTAAELASGEFMPLTECALMLRCAPARLTSAASSYNILSFRHPHTNRIWVRIEDAERVAHYRSAGFLFRYLPVAEVHYIMSTRRHIDRWWDDGIVRRYYVPELAHLGAATTSAEWNSPNAQKAPKNAPQAKVASVPARTGKHGGRQAANRGKK